MAPANYDSEVTGFKVVQSWLSSRMPDRSGNKSSPIDDIHPERWTFDDDLLNLLWVLAHSVALHPTHAALLERIVAGEVFRASGLDALTYAEAAVTIIFSNSTDP